MRQNCFAPPPLELRSLQVPEIRVARACKVGVLMPSGPQPDDPADLPVPLNDLDEVLSQLNNDDLLAGLDLVLLELEKRLLKYAQTGSDFLEMANEGLVLAVRSRARLTQAVSAAQHAESHLQVVGVGDWKPRSTSPGWRDDPRVTDE